MRDRRASATARKRERNTEGRGTLACSAFEINGLAAVTAAEDSSGLEVHVQEALQKLTGGRGQDSIKALTINTGQTDLQRYLKPLLELIESGRIAPSFVITHVLLLEKAPEAYATFRKKLDECITVVLKPGGARPSDRWSAALFVATPHKARPAGRASGRPASNSNSETSWELMTFTAAPRSRFRSRRRC